jgi:hypothetical protein
MTINQSKITEDTSQLKTPLSFSQKKVILKIIELKTNISTKRILLRKQIIIADSRNTYSSIEKNEKTATRVNTWFKGLISING